MEDFETNNDFLQQSKKFILTKAEDKEISKLGRYKTEGKYVPKVLFISKYNIYLTNTC